MIEECKKALSSKGEEFRTNWRSYMQGLERPSPPIAPETSDPMETEEELNFEASQDNDNEGPSFDEEPSNKTPEAKKDRTESPL